MSMSVQYYVGFYFKCEKNDEIDPNTIFPDEDFCRIYDEGGSPEINDFNIFIPNNDCPNCFYLQNDRTGLLDGGENFSIPEQIERAGNILNQYYKEVEMRYGIIAYVC